MKYNTAIALAFAGSAAADWQDWSSSADTVVPTSISYPGWPKTTSSKPVEAVTTSSSTSYSWADWDPSSTSSKPVKAAATSSTYDWVDWEPTSTSSKPVKAATSTSSAYSWVDWTTSAKPVVKTTTSSKPVVATTSAGYVWADWSSTSTTSKPVVAATTSSYGWADWSSTTSSKPVSPATSPAAGWPVQAGVCQVVVVTVTGSPIWVPTPNPWLGWSTSSSKPVAPTSSKPVVASSSSYYWGDWTTASAKPVVATTAKSSSSSYYWGDWTSTSSKPVVATSASTSSSSYYWADWTSSSSSSPAAATTTTTSSAAGWTTSTKPAATSSTSAPPAPVATCPASGGKTLKSSGSCQCEYQVNCGVQAQPVPPTAKFWDGATVGSLAECLARCDDNAKCQQALWTDDQSSGDYLKCWQISGLGPVSGSGIAQISYKGACSGSCAQSYGG